jgi:beta-glucosidase
MNTMKKDMKIKTWQSIIILVFIGAFTLSSCKKQSVPDYKNPNCTVDKRVKDLLSRMTIEEKVAQTIAIWEKLGKDGKFSPDTSDFNAKFGLGTIHRRYNNISLYDGAKESNAIQKYFIEKTRLGIPVIINGEGLHGIVANNATIYPQAISLASTWDKELFHEVFTSVARQARALGIHQLFSPNIDIIREPRWGRVQENYSEDPYLTTELGELIINALQGSKSEIDSNHVASTAKHFAVHSQPEGGLNTAPGDISERIIREDFFPSFKAAFEKCNSRFVMISYNEIDGIPTHISKWLLQDILRKEWNYKGITISDYNAVNNLYDKNFVAENKSVAARKALLAGIDMDLSENNSYITLVEQIKQGKIDKAVLDKAVERILRLKFEMGLFDHPFVDPEKTKYVINTEGDKALALKAAREGVILLKNKDNILPLDKNKVKSLAVIGPNAEQCQFGGYSGNTSSGVSVLDGIIHKLGKNKVKYALGCRISKETKNKNSSGEVFISNEDKNSINQAVMVAKNSDIVVLALGENDEVDAEGTDVNDLDLVGAQNELAKAIIATGKPVIVILINGRPLTIRYIAENANAILEGWYLGQSTGDALADVLFGDMNPGGKLTVTIPESVGNLPCYYYKKPSVGVGNSMYAFSNNKPLYPFGFGLSYTTFDYKNLKVTPEKITKTEKATASVVVTNTGSIKGDEIVQLYIHDLLSSLTRPIMELKGFQRISLAPGESKTVEFDITPEKLSYYNENMEWVIDPGFFDIMVGTNSAMTKNAKLQVIDSKMN